LACDNRPCARRRQAGNEQRPRLRRAAAREPLKISGSERALSAQSQLLTAYAAGPTVVV